MEARKVWCVLLVLSLVALVTSRPKEEDYDDSEESADDRKGDVGRVQIKVYRGPTKSDGYAPWGFWVKQPSDEE